MSRFEEDTTTQIPIDNSTSTTTPTIVAPSSTTEPEQSNNQRQKKQRQRDKQRDRASETATTTATAVSSPTATPSVIFEEEPHINQRIPQTTRDRNNFSWPPTLPSPTSSPSTTTEEGEEEDSESSNTNRKKRQKQKQQKQQQGEEEVEVETSSSPTSSSSTLIDTKPEVEPQPEEEDITSSSPTTVTTPTNKNERSKQTKQQSDSSTTTSSSAVSETPTQFPTYLTTTYYPTPIWPTYSPTLFDQMPTSKRQMITQREKKAAAKQIADMQAAGLTYPPSISMSPTSTTPLTDIPTHAYHRVGSDSRFGEDTVHRPFNHGGLGTEIIPTPSPSSTSVAGSSEPEPTIEPESTVRGPSRYTGGGGRGSYSSRFGTDEPTTTVVEVNSTKVLGMENKTIEEIEQERFGSVPTLMPVSSNGRGTGSGGGGGRWSGGYTRYSSTDDPTSKPTEAPTTDMPTLYDGTYTPTYSPVDDGMERFGGDHHQKTTPAPTTLVPTTPKPTRAKMDITIRDASPPSPREPKTSTKLNLVFKLTSEPTPAPNDRMSLNFYGRGKPTPLPPVSSDEPTYFIYPTYVPSASPIEVVNPDDSTSTPTLWPSYFPTTDEERVRPPSKEQFANERYQDFWSGDEHEEEEEEEEVVDPLLDDLGTSLYEKRICPVGQSNNGNSPPPKIEERVHFTYSIQTKHGKHDRTIERNVEIMSLWLLEDVATHLLNCRDGVVKKSVSVERSSFGSRRRALWLSSNGGILEQSVSSVYYMENESIATLSECTPTVANATDCAIVKSSIYVTANTGHEDEVRANALTLINHRLERGTYEQGTILHTSYLGPDLNKLSLIGNNGQVGTLNGGSSSISSSSSSSHPTIFYVAIGVVSLAAIALIAFLALAFKVHTERKRREVREVSSITGHSANSGQSHRSAVMSVEDLHVSYGPGSSSRNSGHFITPQSTPEDYDKRYLLGQRTQRF